jgi:inorganic pyrophosphatase
MSDPEKIDPFGEGGEVRMVVETPRGSPVKLKYNAKLQVFSVSRSLPLGITYPFDWGFIPGTKGQDGDPIDALAIHDTATFPGVLLNCRLLGVVELKQKSEEGGWEDNPRYILMPTWHDRFGEFEKAAELPDRLKKEIEQFFLSTDFFTHKHPKIEGWKGPSAAEKHLRASIAK